MGRRSWPERKKGLLESDIIGLGPWGWPCITVTAGGTVGEGDLGELVAGGRAST